MYNLIEFGNKIRTIRKNMHLSQIEVTKFIAMQRDTLRRIENGEVIPRIETIDKLSVIYKVDCMKIFTDYKISVDNYVTNNISRISKKFRNYKFDSIQDEIIKFEEIFNLLDYHDDDYSTIKTQQYKLYLKCLASIFKTLDDKSRALITELYLSLDLPKTKNKKTTYHFDKLEMRIIILLSTVYRFKDEFISSQELLEITLKNLLDYYRNDKEFLYFYLLIQLNQMSYYHRIDKRQKVRELYQESLEIIDAEIGINNLSIFLIRAGINKHLEKEAHLDGFVQVALQLLKDSGDIPKYEANYKKLTEMYEFLDFTIKYEKS
jgi:transcriptional regulator with XRE-family HTH domain